MGPSIKGTAFWGRSVCRTHSQLAPELGVRLLRLALVVLGHRTLSVRQGGGKKDVSRVDLDCRALDGFLIEDDLPVVDPLSRRLRRRETRKCDASRTPGGSGVSLTFFEYWASRWAPVRSCGARDISRSTCRSQISAHNGGYTTRCYAYGPVDLARALPGTGPHQHAAPACGCIREDAFRRSYRAVSCENREHSDQGCAGCCGVGICCQVYLSRGIRPT